MVKKGIYNIARPAPFTPIYPTLFNSTGSTPMNERTLINAKIGINANKKLTKIFLN